MWPVLSLRKGLLGLSGRNFLSLYNLFRAETDQTAVLEPLLILEPASICGSKKGISTFADRAPFHATRKCWSSRMTGTLICHSRRQNPCPQGAVSSPGLLYASVSIGGVHCSLPSPHSLPCWCPIRAVVHLFPMSHPVTVRPNLMQSLLCVSSSCATWNLLAHVGLLGFLLTAELYGPVPLPHTEWPSCSHGGRPA